eukprot:GEMP01059754.1.p1 GENE.GEMP01059754.1~~GEMP01059754.1.p1  ORF type:complete len:238 (+),score=39.66 GEMP01059754.1:50-715(+)
MSALTDTQKEFVEFCLELEVLRFGDFTLKSGRKSPYFFNAGLFSTGSALKRLGEFYARAIVNSGLEFDTLFGPAYKGIPLASATSIALSVLDKDRPFCFNRKEVKDHGEGGVLVGKMQGRVLVIDDVITAGTAIRESVDLLKKQDGCSLAGIILAMDRQEKTPTAETSAVQQVRQDFGVPVVSIIKLEHLLAYVEGGYYKGATTEFIEKIKAYRDDYGVDQ